MNEFESKSLNEMEQAIRESSLTKTMGDELIKMGQKRALKIMTKNKREIKRLEKLGHEALAYGNAESYKYAVGKIRRIIGKPVDDEILEKLWITSREQILNLIHAGTEAEKHLKG